jgi:hypothetical protein
MGTNRNAQISVWCVKENFAYFMGRKTLRTLAYAILKATQPAKRRAVGKSGG